MSDQVAERAYEKSKVRRAMLLAPIAGLLGIVPYFFVLNLSVGQMFAVLIVGLIISYVGGVLLGAPGYFLLKASGRSQSVFLMGYAILLVLLLALLLQDSSVLISIGPPVILAAGAFCWLRGDPVDTAESA